MYHCTVKKFSRSQGQSAPAAAAYRAGALLCDERTGEIHDYRRRSGVVSSHIVLPDEHPEWATNRNQLWSQVELAEKRKNSVVAREVEIALPAELDAAERERLAVGFTAELVNRYGVAAEISVHEPSREGDQRNHHAHILISTRRLLGDGFAEKTRELDDKRAGPQQVSMIREVWAEKCNQALERSGHTKRVDHRSLSAQREEQLIMAEKHIQKGTPEAAERARERAIELDREPQKHQGPARTAMARKSFREMVVEMRQRFTALAGRLDKAIQKWRARDKVHQEQEARRPDTATAEKLVKMREREKKTRDGKSVAERMAALRQKDERHTDDQKNKDAERQRSRRGRGRDPGDDFGL